MYDELKIKEINSTEIGSVDFKKLHAKTLVDISKQLRPEPVALSIGTYEYKGTTYPIPFGTYGNFSCLVGESKSKKTFFKTAIVACYIGGKANNYFSNIKGHESKDKFVLDIDTEQSIFHTQRVAKRVCAMVGTNPEFYKPFSLREEDPKTRYQFVEWCMMESEYKNNIGLVTLDGAADVTDNVNDLEFANKTVQGLMKWTSISKSHLCTILHKNHGTDKPTGHLGSAIVKKAETVAFIKTDKDEVSVTADYTRNFPFDSFLFKINEDHLPQLIEHQF